MPIRFLIGSLILGTQLFNHAIEKEAKKEYKEKVARDNQEELRKEKEYFNQINPILRKKFNELYNKYKYCHEEEVPNAFVKGGQLLYVRDAVSVEETKIAAENTIVSYGDAQPRWRFAKQKDFERIYETKKGIMLAVYARTRFYFASNYYPMRDEDWELLEEAVEKKYIWYYMNEPSKTGHYEVDRRL